MIALTQEQIEAGRVAATRRTPKWKPTSAVAVELAYSLWQERGKFSSRVECHEVAASDGVSSASIRHRYLMGELGLPTPNVARALAFSEGQMTYTRADGSVRYVNDDLNYYNDRANWSGSKVYALGAAFSGLTGADYERMLASCGKVCPCCGAMMDGATSACSPTLDHLVPGILDKSNARLICASCNRIKFDALPWMIHRVADWMTLTPAEMIERARTLPEMDRKRLDGSNRMKCMLRNKRSSARRKGIEFGLTLEDVVWSASCPVFSVPFLLPGGAARYEVKVGPAWNSPNFDRIDPTRGYVPGNVVLVSTLANYIKNNATSATHIRQVADWFDRELEAAPELAAMVDQDASRKHWLLASPEIVP